MRVVILFEPDEDCVDPKDRAKIPRRHYDEVPRSGDVIVMWREYGEAFRDGSRTHYVGSGIFEHVREKDLDKAIAKLLRV